MNQVDSAVLAVADHDSVRRWTMRRGNFPAKVEAFAARYASGSPR